MPAVDPVRLELGAGRGTVTLANPGRANAMSALTVAQLARACARIEADPPECVMFVAEGTSFCGGFDLDDVVDVTDEALRERFARVQDVLIRVAALPTITVAVVGGAAIGAGADLVAACDIRAGTPAAFFQFPGPRFGLLLGTERQHQILTPEGFAELILATRRADAAAAHRYGLLTHLIPGADSGTDTGAWTGAVARDLARRGDGARAYQLDLLRGRRLPSPPDLVRRSLAAPGLAQRIGLKLNRNPPSRKDTTP